MAAIFLPGLGRVKFDSVEFWLCPQPHVFLSILTLHKPEGPSQAHRFCMIPPRGGSSQEKQQREPRLGVELGKERRSLGQSFHFLRPMWVVVNEDEGRTQRLSFIS